MQSEPSHPIRRLSPQDVRIAKESWVLAISILVFASLLFSLGSALRFIVSKRSLADPLLPPRYPYRLVGSILMFLGSVGPFAALVFASMSIVAPVATLVYPASCILHYWIRSVFPTKRQLVGCALVVCGVIMSVGAGNIQTPLYTIDELFHFYRRPHFIAHTCTALGFILFILLAIRYSYRSLASPYISTRTKLKYNLFLSFSYPCIAGIIGSMTFFYTKTLVDLMSASANDRGDLFFWDRRTYPIVAGFFLSLFFLIYWLHIAITDFSQEIALAHFHSVWTFSSIFIGGVVLSEFEYISAVKCVFFPIGILICIIGIYFYYGILPPAVYDMAKIDGQKRNLYSFNFGKSTSALDNVLFPALMTSAKFSSTSKANQLEAVDVNSGTSIYRADFSSVTDPNSLDRGMDINRTATSSGAISEVIHLYRHPYTDSLCSTIGLSGQTEQLEVSKTLRSTLREMVGSETTILFDEDYLRLSLRPTLVRMVCADAPNTSTIVSALVVSSIRLRNVAIDGWGGSVPAYNGISVGDMLTRVNGVSVLQKEGASPVSASDLLFLITTVPGPVFLTFRNITPTSHRLLWFYQQHIREVNDETKKDEKKQEFFTLSRTSVDFRKSLRLEDSSSSVQLSPERVSKRVSIVIREELEDIKSQLHASGDTFIPSTPPKRHFPPNQSRPTSIRLTPSKISQELLETKRTRAESDFTISTGGITLDIYHSPSLSQLNSVQSGVVVIASSHLSPKTLEVLRSPSPFRQPLDGFAVHPSPLSLYPPTAEQLSTGTPSNGLKAPQQLLHSINGSFSAMISGEVNSAGSKTAGNGSVLDSSDVHVQDQNLRAISMGNATFKMPNHSSLTDIVPSQVSGQFDLLHSFFYCPYPNLPEHHPFHPVQLLEKHSTEDILKPILLDYETNVYYRATEEVFNANSDFSDIENHPFMISPTFVGSDAHLQTIRRRITSFVPSFILDSFNKGDGIWFILVFLRNCFFRLADAIIDIVTYPFGKRLPNLQYTNIVLFPVFSKRDLSEFMPSSSDDVDADNKVEVRERDAAGDNNLGDPSATSDPSFTRSGV